ncbi:MAG: hypothetical protein IJ550_10540 [Bacteroidaceae bacterium]|nr:hypothetical protein [Bacteroidaceae bacterium]
MRIYAFLVVCLFSQWVLAEDVQKLVISKNDGTEVSFLLRDKPKITFGIADLYYLYYNVYNKCRDMTITTTDHKIVLSTLGLDKMTVVTADVTGVFNLVHEKETEFTLLGDALYVEVVTGNTMIAVYDVGGKKILSKNLAVGKHALSLSELPKGMNIIKIDKETLKIWNR